MADLLGFNANNVAPAGSFDPIPEGKYTALISDSQMKATKNGLGTYLEITYEILEGQFKGRRLWSRLNLQNPNQQAVQIAQGELSAICRAVGIMTPGDSCELHNLPMVIGVKCRKRPDSGEITNEVRGWWKPGENGAKPTASVQSAVPAAQPAALSASSSMPWKR